MFTHIQLTWTEHNREFVQNLQTNPKVILQAENSTVYQL